MTGHLRIKSPLSQLGIFLGSFGGAFLFTVMGMAFYLLMKGAPVTGKVDLISPEMLPTFKWIQGLSSIFMFLMPALLYAWITFYGKRLYFLGLKKAETISMYGLGILCILMAFPFVFWLGEINQLLPLPKWMIAMEKDAAKTMEAFLKVNSTSDIVINVIIIALLPAVCEELCFRGALQRIMIHLTKHPWAGIIITGFLFSALHLQFQGFLPRMFLGVVLGAMYWYSGSLWTSIIAHFVNNAVQVIAVSYAPKYVDENPTIPIYAALISGLLVFGILWLFKRFSTVTYSKVYRIDDLTPTNQFLA